MIGLAIVPHELAVDGGRFDVQVDGRAVADDACTSGPFFDPDGREAEGMTGVLDFLSVAARRDADGFHPVAQLRRRARSSATRGRRSRSATAGSCPTSVPGEAEHCARVGIADISHLGKLEIRPAPAATVEGDGVV